MTSPNRSRMEVINPMSQADVPRREANIYESDEEDEQSHPGKEVRGSKEPLFDFLERQTRNQIKFALGNKMMPVSKKLVESVRKQDEAKHARRAKDQLYKTPGKKKEDWEQSRSAQRLKYLNASATNFDVEGNKFQQLEDGQRVILKEPDMPYPHEVRDSLKQLVDNIKDKQSLVDLFRQKLEQNKNVYQSVRTSLQLGKSEMSEKTFENIDEKLIDLQNQNTHWWNTLDDNENANAHLLDDLSELLSVHDRERQALKEGYQNQIDRQRAYDKAQYEKEITKLSQDLSELTHENKILQENYKQGGATSQEHKQLVQELANLENHAQYLKDELKQREREKGALHVEVNKLNGHIREIEKLYEQELTLQKEKVSQTQRQNQHLLEQLKIAKPEMNHHHEGEIMQLQNDNDRLRQEVYELRAELERKAQEPQGEMLDRERYEGQIQQYKNEIEELAIQRAKQKNEWAEIYGNLKQEIEDSKQDTQLLNAENQRLVQQMQLMEQDASIKGHSDRDALKRLKKKELECNQLWETIRDMHISNKGVFDARQMMDLLSIRQLDTKAKRKLKIL